MSGVDADKRTVEQIQNIFPDQSVGRIALVLESQGGNAERAIEHLLWLQQQPNESQPAQQQYNQEQQRSWRLNLSSQIVEEAQNIDRIVAAFIQNSGFQEASQSQSQSQHGSISSEQEGSRQGESRLCTCGDFNFCEACTGFRGHFYSEHFPHVGQEDEEEEEEEEEDEEEMNNFEDQEVEEEDFEIFDEDDLGFEQQISQRDYRQVQARRHYSEFVNGQNNGNAAVGQSQFELQNDGDTSTEDKCVVCLTNAKKAGFAHGNSIHKCVCCECSRHFKAGDDCPVCHKTIQMIIQNIYE